MGMTIDNAIGLLERGSQYNYCDSAEDFCTAYDMAIETMRKYQKIEDIYYHQTGRALEDSLREVIENGKID